MTVSKARWAAWQLAEYRRYSACARCGVIAYNRGARPGRVYCLQHIPLRKARAGGEKITPATATRPPVHSTLPAKEA